MKAGESTALYLGRWEKSRVVVEDVSASGGNQRELARQKNLKKTQDLNKGKRKDDTLSAAQRKQRDSEIMQMKQRAANEKKCVPAGAK
ncbi:small EDRK-rich factor 1 [Gastrophryne carolinensis]